MVGITYLHFKMHRKQRDGYLKSIDAFVDIVENPKLNKHYIL